MSETVLPERPHRRVAPATHPLELQRLAAQEASHPDCDPLNFQTMTWLIRAYSAAMNAQAEMLRPVGLSPSGFNVLMALRGSPGFVQEPHQLAERLVVTRPSMTGLLDTLQARGLVVRRRHEVDGRRVLVELTAAGQELLEALGSRYFAEQNRLFAPFEPDELVQLIGLLRRVPGAMPAHLVEERP